MKNSTKLLKNQQILTKSTKFLKIAFQAFPSFSQKHLKGQSFCWILFRKSCKMFPFKSLASTKLFMVWLLMTQPRHLFPLLQNTSHWIIVFLGLDQSFPLGSDWISIGFLMAQPRSKMWYLPLDGTGLRFPLGSTK